MIDESSETCFPARLGLYCFAHYIIDLATTYILIGYIWYKFYDIPGYILFYGIAFAGQMPLGLLADKLNRNGLVASCGCLVMILACMMMYSGIDSFYYFILVLGALGNALVHVGGGIDVINHCGMRKGPLGLFVSPGYLGLFTGVLLTKCHGDFNIEISIVLALTAIAIPMLQKRSLGSLKSQNPPLSLRVSLPNSPRLWIAAAVTALFVVVCMRAYLGLSAAFEWKNDWYWFYFLVGALVAGKATGGLLSDRFGMLRTAIVSLVAASVLYAFPGAPVAGVLAVFFFNMTMPMTLWALSRIFNQARGFAFGTLTLSLFLGFWLSEAHPEPLIPMGLGFSAAALLSLALLYIGIRPLNNALFLR